MITEGQLEQLCLEWFQSIDYDFVCGSDRAIIKGRRVHAIIETLDDIVAMQESVDVECKLAQGRDGKGALPKDVWETYSAFANTQGGDIFLGLKEKSDHRFELKGVENPQKVMDEFWATVANRQKVSCNLMRERWVKTLTIDGKNLGKSAISRYSNQQLDGM